MILERIGQKHKQPQTGVGFSSTGCFIVELCRIHSASDFQATSGPSTWYDFNFSYTPPLKSLKFNMERQNRHLEKEIPFGKLLISTELPCRHQDDSSGGGPSFSSPTMCLEIWGVPNHTLLWFGFLGTTAPERTTLAPRFFLAKAFISIAARPASASMMEALPPPCFSLLGWPWPWPWLAPQPMALHVTRGDLQEHTALSAGFVDRAHQTAVKEGCQKRRRQKECQERCQKQCQ